MQRTHLAVFPPGEATDDWKAIAAIAGAYGKPLAYNTLSGVRERLVQVNQVFAHVDAVTAAAWGAFGQDGALDASPLISTMTAFYTVDPISRASKTMAHCQMEFGGDNCQGKTGTHD